MPFSIIIQYNVPFDRKQEAKAKYLKWDPTDKKWYSSFQFNNNTITKHFSKKLEKYFDFHFDVRIEFEIYNIKIVDCECDAEHLLEIKNAVTKIRDIKIEQERENKKQREDPNYICDF